MAENVRNISCDALKSFTAELFTAGGMNPADAAWYAETIVQANLWGIDSHGILRVPAYFERILKDAINRHPQMQMSRRAPAVTLLNADGAGGPLRERPPWSRPFWTRKPTASASAVLPTATISALPPSTAAWRRRME